MANPLGAVGNSTSTAMVSPMLVPVGPRAHKHGGSLTSHPSVPGGGGGGIAVNDALRYEAVSADAMPLFQLLERGNVDSSSMPRRSSQSDLPPLDDIIAALPWSAAYDVSAPPSPSSPLFTATTTTTSSSGESSPTQTQQQLFASSAVAGTMPVSSASSTAAVGQVPWAESHSSPGGPSGSGSALSRWSVSVVSADASSRAGWLPPLEPGTDLNTPPPGWLGDSCQAAMQRDLPWNPVSSSFSMVDMLANLLQDAGEHPGLRDGEEIARGPASEPLVQSLQQGEGQDGSKTAQRARKTSPSSSASRKHRASPQRGSSLPTPPNVFCPAERLKEILLACVNGGGVSFVAHRIGPTLILEGNPDTKGPPYKTVKAARNEALRSKLLYFSILAKEFAEGGGASPAGSPSPLPPPPPLVTDAAKADDGGAQSSNPTRPATASPARSPTTSAPPPAGAEGSTSAPAIATSVDRRQLDAFPDTSASRSSGAPSGNYRNDDVFRKSLKWNFGDLSVLLGVETPTVRVPPRNAEVALHMVDVEGRPPHPVTSAPALTRDEALSLWLDAIMANVDGVALCYHTDGVVQGYQVVSAAHIPSLSGADDAFQPLAVQKEATNILRWLNTACTRSGGSYVVIKLPGSSTLRLYDISMESASATSAASHSAASTDSRGAAASSLSGFPAAAQRLQAKGGTAPHVLADRAQLSSSLSTLPQTLPAPSCDSNNIDTKSNAQAFQVARRLESIDEDIPQPVQDASGAALTPKPRTDHHHCFRKGHATYAADDAETAEGREASHRRGQHSQRPSLIASRLQQAYAFPVAMMCLRMSQSLPNSDAETLRLLHKTIALLEDLEQTSSYDEVLSNIAFPAAKAHAMCMDHLHSSSPLLDAEQQCLAHAQASLRYCRLAQESIVTWWRGALPGYRLCEDKSLSGANPPEPNVAAAAAARTFRKQLAFRRGQEAEVDAVVASVVRCMGSLATVPVPAARPPSAANDAKGRGSSSSAAATPSSSTRLATDRAKVILEAVALAQRGLALRRHCWYRASGPSVDNTCKSTIPSPPSTDGSSPSSSPVTAAQRVCSAKVDDSLPAVPPPCDTDFPSPSATNLPCAVVGVAANSSSACEDLVNDGEKSSASAEAILATLVGDPDLLARRGKEVVVAQVLLFSAMGDLCWCLMTELESESSSPGAGREQRSETSSRGQEAELLEARGASRISLLNREAALLRSSGSSDTVVVSLAPSTVLAIPPSPEQRSASSSSIAPHASSLDPPLRDGPPPSDVLQDVLSAGFPLPEAPHEMLRVVTDMYRRGVAASEWVECACDDVRRKFAAALAKDASYLAAELNRLAPNGDNVETVLHQTTAAASRFEESSAAFRDVGDATNAVMMAINASKMFLRRAKILSSAPSASDGKRAAPEVPTSAERAAEEISCYIRAHGVVEDAASFSLSEVGSQPQTTPAAVGPLGVPERTGRRKREATGSAAIEVSQSLAASARAHIANVYLLALRRATADDDVGRLWRQTAVKAAQQDASRTTATTSRDASADPAGEQGSLHEHMLQLLKAPLHDAQDLNALANPSATDAHRALQATILLPAIRHAKRCADSYPKLELHILFEVMSYLLALAGVPGVEDSLSDVTDKAPSAASFKPLLHVWPSFRAPSSWVHEAVRVDDQVELACSAVSKGRQALALSVATPLDRVVLSADISTAYVFVMKSLASLQTSRQSGGRVAALRLHEGSSDSTQSFEAGDDAELDLLERCSTTIVDAAPALRMLAGQERAESFRGSAADEQRLRKALSCLASHTATCALHFTRRLVGNGGGGTSSTDAKRVEEQLRTLIRLGATVAARVSSSDSDNIADCLDDVQQVVASLRDCFDGRRKKLSRSL